MRASTKLGFLTGGVVGVAVGASLLMSPKSRDIKRAVNWGMAKAKKEIHDHIG